MKNPKFSHTFEVVAEFPESLQPLLALAKNYRWTWNHATQDLFRTVDKELWEECEHNPIRLITEISPERAKKLTSDPVFIAKMAVCRQELSDYLNEPTWFDSAYPGEREKTTIAYFCAEFGISESLPIYSGGLGVLAGDHLKAASDLGIPLVGVGLLYGRGYFRQRLNHGGWQQEQYPEYDYYNFPLELMRHESGQAIQVTIEFPDRTVNCQIWKAEVGRISLYLLDSNVLENAPHDQGITDTLYGGDEDMRIRQEMILGIGGMKALQAVGIDPTVCHMNEGHAAFLSIERIRQYVEKHGCELKTARQVIVSGNVFTTHTPVPAGFDIFTSSLLEKYTRKSIESAGMKFSEFHNLGKVDPDDESEAFNMAVLAMSNANYVNGVAKLHAHVTRQMFSHRWPAFPESEVPVDAVTNGIHTMTWVNEKMSNLFDEYLGPNWRRDPSDPAIWNRVDDIPDDEIWNCRENLRGDLVRYVRKRLQSDLTSRKLTSDEFSSSGQLLDPRILTIGFARRFATYKRASLMLTDKERFKKILFHEERPVQILIAGKAHPRDDAGKKIIQDLVNFIQNEGARNRMVFVEDYDMEIARNLIQGVDVWLNNPRRPNEASGTSGMKVVPNGGINCSVLDGWWDEGYDPKVGFAIGEGTDFGDHGHQDWLDSRSLYSVLEREIVPKFYHRVDNGLPSQWIAMMKASIKKLAPYFSTARMVRDYATKAYVPASRAYCALSENNQEQALLARTWREKVQKEWNEGHVQIRSVSDSAGRAAHHGGFFEVQAKVSIGALDVNDVEVQALVGKIGSNRELVHQEIIALHPVDQSGEAIEFKAKIPCDVPGHRGYVIRVVPKHPLVSVIHELPIVIWEKVD